MMIIKMINNVDGKVQILDQKKGITFDDNHSSLQLDISPNEISSAVREGNNLLIVLKNGETLIIRDYFLYAQNSVVLGANPAELVQLQFTEDATGALVIHYNPVSSVLADGFSQGLLLAGGAAFIVAGGVAYVLNSDHGNKAATLSSATISLDETNSPLTASGQLTIDDIDSPETFVAQTDTEGKYGKFSIDADGKWNYVAHAAHDELATGESYTETFTVESADGTKTSVTVTINGTNDAAVLSSAAVQLSETNAVLSTNGTLTITDVDSAATFVAQNNTAGTYGKFSIDATGAWSYVANSAYNELNVGDSRTDTFEVVSADGTKTFVTVTINGTNDAAVLSSAAVQLDETNAALSTGGTLTISDVDSPATFVAQNNTAGTYGKFSIDAAGAWSYVADSAYNELNVGDSRTDTFEVVSADGTKTSVTVTINGTNDAAVLSSAAVQLSETNTALSTGGTLTISDVDSAATFVAQNNTAGTYGKFSIDASGAWSYVADSAYNELNVGDSRTDTFEVVSADGTKTSVTVIINGTNDNPTSSDQTKTINEDTFLNGQIIATDVEGDNLSYAIQSGVAHGTLVLNSATGAYTYTPATNYNGTDSFTVTISDGKGGSTTSTVNITVTPVNDVPETNYVTASGNEDAMITVTLSGSDKDGSVAGYIIKSQPTNGTLYTDATMSTTIAVGDLVTSPVYFMPNANWYGSTDFSYAARDNLGAEDATPANVSITINPVADAAVLSSGTGSVKEDTPTQTTASGTLTITDPDAGEAAFVAQTNTAGTYGSFSISAVGTWTYNLDNSKPSVQALKEGETKTESFTVSSIDGTTTTVTVTVTGTNDAPVAVVDSFTVAEGGTGTGNVLSNDTDAEGNTLTAILVTGPANGALTLNANGTFTYIHNGSETTSDSFSYKVNDGTVDGNTVTVTIHVTPVNDAPTSSDQSKTTAEDTVLNGHISATDAEGDTLIYSLQSGAAHGSISLNTTTGAYTYTPATNYNGSDSFTVTISDGNGGSTTSTVNITVTSVNDAPVANNDTATVDENDSVTIAVRANDTDAEGDALTVSAVTQGANGSVVIDVVTGNPVYTPNTGFSGTDSFTYTLNDGNGGTTTATVNVTVNAVNHAPEFTTPGEFLVNTYTTDLQQSSSITALKDGGFVVTWQSLNQKGNYDIHAQRYDQDSKPVQAEFLVNSTTADSQKYPSITALKDGGFVVTWLSNQEGSYNIYAQRYDQDGKPDAKGEFLVNSTTADPQESPSITALDDGGFVVTWQSSQNGKSDIHAQRYDQDGKPDEKGEFLVNTTTASTQSSPSITALDDGGFVVTWMSWNQNDNWDIYAQRYDQDGKPDANGEFLVNTTTANEQSNPSITALADGGFVVTWQSYQNGNWDINAQRYDQDGNPVQAEFLVNTATTDSQQYPSITVLKDGSFVVTWQSGTFGNYDIYAQRYDKDGNKVQDEFLVNSTTASNQYNPSITALDDGGFVVTWDSFQNGSYDIYAQRYDKDGIAYTTTGSVTENAAVDTVKGRLTATDPDAGDTLTYSIPGAFAGTYNGIYGSLTLDSTTGQWVYNLDNYRMATQSLGKGSMGNETFTVRVTDSKGAYTETEVKVTVLGTNDVAGITGIMTGAVKEDTLAQSTVSDTLTVKDLDANEAAFVAQTSTAGTYGSFSISAAGTWTYNLDNSMPSVQALKEGETKTESFTVSSIDGTTKTVTVTITGTNDAPVAVVDTGTMNQGSVLTLTPAQLLGNDMDIDGDTLSISSVQGAVHGTVRLVSGNVEFTPTVGYYGPASFTYTISDGQGGSSTATVTVTVNKIMAVPFIAPSNGAVLTGTAEADSTVILTDGYGNPIGQLTADGAGYWSFTPGASLANGTVINVVARDAAGNISTPASTIVDAVPPPAPDPSNGTVMTGTAEANSKVILTDGNGNRIGEVTADGTGYWSFMPAAPLANGTVINVVVSDAAGNVSVPASTTVDSVPPPAPILFSSNGTVITGKAEANSTIILIDDFDNRVFGHALVDGNGNWSFAPGMPLAHGTLINAAAKDATGNISALASTTVDAVAPPAPALDLSNGTVITGKAEANATIILTDGNGNPVGQTSANGSGNWSFTPGTTLAHGTLINAAAKDAAGNISAPASTTVSSAASVNTAPDAKDDSATPAQTSTGLLAEYFGYNEGTHGANLTSAQQVYSFIYGRTADATFSAKTFDYGSDFTSGNNLGFGTNLQSFLGSDAASLSTDPATTTDAIIRISGFVELSAGTYNFQVLADDGYQILIDGVIVADQNTTQSATTITHDQFTLAAGGLHHVEIIYWDQGAHARLKVELSDNAGTTYNLLGTVPNYSSSIFAGTEDTPLNIAATALLGNDTDADGDTLSITGVQGAVNGTVSLVGGNITFIPAPNYAGPAGFTYTISDGKGGTDTATVNLTIVPVNDAPVAVGDTGLVGMNSLLSIPVSTLLANDTDIEGNTLSIVSVQGATNGTVSLSGSNVTFTPNVGFEGQASFSYTIRDTAGATSTATVNVAVGSAVAPSVVVSKSLLAVAHGTGGTSVKFPVVTALVDTDGSESLSIKISNVPTGLSFNAGTNLGGGVWQFSSADLPNLTLNLPGSYTTLATYLTVQVTATEINGGATASVSSVVMLKAAYTTVDITTTESGSYTGSSANEYIQGGNGNNTINGSSGNNIIHGGAGDDDLTTAAGSDVINGGSGNDIINAGRGTDCISGGAGNDTLIGGDAGENFVDLFNWALGDQGAAGIPAVDTIVQFDTAAINADGTGGDVLDLSELLQGESVGASNSTGNLGNYLHFEISGSDTIIHISHTGGFTGDAHTIGASYTTTAETQQVILSGVNLQSVYAGATTDDQFISQLLNNNKLIIG